MYERLVATLAGPLATGIGLVATAIVHQNVSHDSALNVATFAVSAAVTYAAHHKWLDNVPKWWAHVDTVGNQISADISDLDVPPDLVATSKTDPTKSEAADK